MMPDDRKICIMIGRCFTSELGYLLLRSEEFKRDYRLVVFNSVATNHFSAEFSRIVEELEKASLIIYQPLVWATWGDDALYNQLMSLLPKNLRQITFPYPVFHTLWPFNYNDTARVSAIVADPLDDENALLFAYGDANVVTMIRRGMSAEQILTEYLGMDLPSMIDLEQMTASIIDDQRIKEADTDVKILDFVLDTYKRQQVFVCVNHGSNRLLINMADQILHELGYSPLPRRLLDGLCQLIDPAIPVHPSIVRYYALKWVRPGMRYKIDRRRNLTFEEYIYELVTN